MIHEEVRQRFEEKVVSRLRSLGRRLRVYVAVDGSAVLSLAILAAIAATFAIDRTFWLPRDMRVVQLTTLMLVLGYIAYRWIVRPLSVPVGDQQLALLVEHRHPLLESRLISAVEFAAPSAAQLHPPATRSPALIDALIRQAEENTEHLNFFDTLCHQRVRQRAAITLGCLLALTIAAGFAGESMSLWFRRNVLLTNVPWPQRNRLTIQGVIDGKMVTPRGDDAVISALVDEGFEPPRQVYIDYQGETGSRGRDQMPAVSDQDSGITRFTYTFERLNEGLGCQIRGGDARPAPFAVEVVDRPTISEVVIGITPPAYTHIEPYDLRPGQTVAETLKGGRIRFRIKTNKPLTQAILVRQTTGQEIEVAHAERLSDLEYVVTDTPETTSNYYFKMLDELGLSNTSERTAPLRLSVRLVPDKPPKVKMKIKGVGEMITNEAILPIEAEFGDVYGLASATLVYELARKDFKPGVEPVSGFEAGIKTFTHAWDWAVAPRGLNEGDRLTLHGQAADFDDIGGPNVGASPTIMLRVVSREELIAELNRREQEYRQDFERLIRQQEELYADFLTLSGPNVAASAETARRFTQLARLQRDNGGRANSIRLQFEQVLSELRVNQLSSVAVEARLGGAVIEPMGLLAKNKMPKAAEELDHLSRELAPDPIQAARAAQEAVLADMHRILANMLKWEGFQEAVTLLREVMKMQGKLSQETENRIESEIFGTQPASEPSK